jgi:WD40 repeat protein
MNPQEQPMPTRTIAVIVVLLASWPGPARSQGDVRDFKKPILIVETDGHHAPVRSLIWRNPFSLLSGGHDKVVRFWDFRDNPRQVRTIRPMIWRGLAGTIYAMALSPKPDAQGQSLLAVAGFGVESRRGDLTVFRVPGLTPSSTGEIVARLMPADRDHPIGHRNSVLTLAFDPSGRILASAGIDNTVVLWDASKVVEAGPLKTFAPVRELKGHTRPIRQLAFLPPDGQRLVTASEDGTVRLWDVATGREVDQLPGHPTRPVIINALAVHPDGKSILIGRENGDLYQLDSQNLRQGPKKLPTRPDQGSVEFLAYHAEGRQLVASLKSDRGDTLDATKIACDVELRDMPAGNVVRTRRVPGLVTACAFSPNGDRLAYSGGMSQAIFIQDMKDWQKPPLELKGLGTTIFDLGFRAKDQVLGFTRTFDPANPPALYDGFDLAQRRSTTVSRDDLRRAIKEYQGWSLVGNVNMYLLEAVNADGRRWRIDLDPIREGLWWSHTFIPPGPGHPRATVAVGCATGVVVFDLETGRRTRMFAGHTSPVVSIVPSPDGHWLASSSIDQTILLYSLAGCDQRPGLGAKFQRQPDGSWTVAEVAPKGFAEAMGLMVGDVVVEAGFQSLSQKQEITPAQQLPEAFWSQLDELAPNDQIGLRVRRKPAKAEPGAAAEVLTLPTTKRNNPAMMLMLDVSREWVLWTPQGYYDTSIEGDTRLLGWHKNPDFDQSQPTDFVPVATFAANMMRPRVLERLWITHSLDEAAAEVPPNVPPPPDQFVPEEPPRITFEAIDPAFKPEPGLPWVLRVPNLKARLRISALGSSRLGARKIVLDEQLLKPLQNIGPGPESLEELEIALPPKRRVRLLVTATNDKQRSRSESIDLEYQPPVEPPPPPPVVPKRLIVLSLGNETFPGAGLPVIRYAVQDAESLAGFLSEHMVAADGTRPDPNLPPGPLVLTGSRASSASVRESLDQLGKLLQDKQLNRGDLIAVVVSSHVLEFKDSKLLGIAVSDTQLDKPAETMISARELSELFGRLTDYGCRVALFLDVVHEGKLPETVRSDVKSWVRNLQQERRVITFVASKEGPSGEPAAVFQHGLFALGMLNAFQRANRDASLTLEQFRTAVVEEVLNLSNRQQEVGCYIPKGVLPWTPFVKP